jgi:hypothetical protein
MVGSRIRYLEAPDAAWGRAGAPRAARDDVGGDDRDSVIAASRFSVRRTPLISISTGCEKGAAHGMRTKTCAADAWRSRRDCCCCCCRAGNAAASRSALSARISASARVLSSTLVHEMVPASVQAVVGINQAERKRVGDWWLSGRHENADAERQTLPQINIEIVWSKAEYETLRV